MRGRARKIGIATTVAVLCAVTALAFWTSTGIGDGDATVGTLTAPVVSLPDNSPNGAHTLDFVTQSTTGIPDEDTNITYRVQRRLGSGSFADVTSGDCSGDLPHPTDDCDDTVLEAGTYTYRVIASFRSWTATSNEEVVVAEVRPDPPIVNDTDPDSPSQVTTPKIKGTAEAGSTVKLYTNVACTSAVAGSGAEAEFSSTGIEVTVDEDSTTEFWATATDEDDNLSDCSSTSVVYVADNTGPSVTIDQKSTQADPTNSLPIRYTVVFSEPVTGFTAADVSLAGTAAGGSVSITGTGATFEVSVSGLTSDGTVIASIPADGAVDAAGNDNSASTSTDDTVTYDTVAPSVTVEQKSGQADPTNTLPILFTVQFSDPVTGFVAGDVTRAGTATGGSVSLTPISSSLYEVSVSGLTSNGTVIVTVGANKAIDAAGNDNTASTSTDNTVTYDSTAPSVTINQKAGQDDPTNDLPILYTVVFSEPVTGFSAGDVSLAGTAAGGSVSITGMGATYEVSVSGLTSDGTVIASIPSGGAADAAGNANSASTSTDNTVTYDVTDPSVTINKKAGQADPTNDLPILFAVVFSEPVSGFTVGDVTRTGTATGGSMSVSGGGATYEVSVDGLTGDGSVTVTVDANTVIDAAGNNNAVSTSTDNTVVYDTTAPDPPTFTATVPASPSSNDSPFIKGSAEPGSIVRLRIFPSCEAGVVAVGTAEEFTSTGLQVDVTQNATTTFYATATDPASNVSSPCEDNTIAYTHDDIAPSIEVTKVNGFTVTFPHNANANVTTLGGTCGTATNDSSTVNVTVSSPASQSLSTACTSGTWSATLTTTLSTEDVYSITATQGDAAGNTGSSGAKSLRVDKTKPIVTAVTADRAADLNGWYNAPVTWTASGTDTGGSGIASCQSIAYTGPDTSGTTVTRTCTDNAGNVSNPGTSATFKFDNTDPSFTLASAAPSSGTHRGGYLADVVYFNFCSSGGFRLTSTVTDATSGAASTNFPALTATNWTTHANETVTTPTGGPYVSGNYSWTATNCGGNSAGTPGPHTITAADSAGNVATRQVTFSPDNETGPTATVQLFDAGVPGTIEANDFLEITYSEPMEATKFCSTWVNGATQSVSGVNASLTAADVLTITATGCSTTFRLGSFALVGNYNTSGTMTFTGGSLSYDPSTRKLKLVLGTRANGTLGTGVGNAIPTYTRSGTASLQEANLAQIAVIAGAQPGTSSRF